MKRILTYFVFVFTAVLLFFPMSVHAQNSPPPANSETQLWFCLNPVNYTESEHTTSLVLKDGITIDTTKPTYIVAKIALNIGDETPSEKDSAMTTGDTALDTKIFNSTEGFISLQNKLGFSGGVVPPGTNPTNTFPIVWKDDLSKTLGEDKRVHFWYGMQEGVSLSTDISGGAGAQQQATFGFEKAKGANDCAFLSWDPFGYVFDSVTHGPIKGVYVRLLTSKTEGGTYSPVPVGIGTGKVSQNPVVTNNDGSYKFYVDPGFYKLELLGDTAKSTNKYIIEKNIKNIKPGYDEFGYEQLYIAEKPEVIHELAGKVERRDIAIETIGAPAPFSRGGPKFKEFFVNRSIQNGVPMVRISGRSFFIPVDLVAVYKDENNIILDEIPFSLTKGHTYLPQNSSDERNFDIWMDVRTKDKKGFLTEVKATSKYSTLFSTFRIDPMPSYLDGIATDKASKPIVSGLVGIYPIGSDKPSFKTTTDKNGHFIVNSDQLPPLPYMLRYTTATGDEVKVTTTEYLKSNASYHAEKLIDSYSVKITNLDSNVLKANNNMKGNTSLNKRTQPTGAQVNKKVASGMQGVVMALIVLVILIVSVGGIFVVMKYKQHQLPPTM